MAHTALVKAVYEHKGRVVQDILKAKAYEFGRQYAVKRQSSFYDGDLQEVIEGLLEGIPYPERETVYAWMSEHIDLMEIYINLDNGVQQERGGAH